MVAKLFSLVRPHRAYFGQKDAQQLAVIKRMVNDLDLRVDIRAVPIIRGADGLAESSRNQHLSATDRNNALALSATLAALRERRIDLDQARAELSNSPAWSWTTWKWLAPRPSSQSPGRQPRPRSRWAQSSSAAHG